ncbi:N-formylglutamate amidohydrolase [Croceicoccus mobilis]|nr:N-formylglutamate amidohydrolase [Croceicoccus mobilis]
MDDDAAQHDISAFGMRSGDDGALVSGGSVPGLSRPAYTLHRPDGVGSPVLIAVPHGGRAYPAELMDRLRHGEAAAIRLEDRFIDMVGRAAAASCGASLLIAHAPRAMLDLNRDTRDLDPGMFRGGLPASGAGAAATGASGRALPRQQPRWRRGLGLFPRSLSGSGELWRAPMNAPEAERRIAAIHVPYHAQLAQELARLRDRHGYAMLIDLHSMPSLPRRAGLPQATHVVGDRFGTSCASAIAACAMECLNRAGVGSAYNRPYAGGYVLDRHADPRGGIHALQLEIDRARYLDGEGRPDDDAIAHESDIVAALARDLAVLLSGMGVAAGWPLADAAE